MYIETLKYDDKEIQVTVFCKKKSVVQDLTSGGCFVNVEARLSESSIIADWGLELSTFRLLELQTQVILCSALDHT